MAFREDDSSSRTPSVHHIIKWYQSRTVKSKLGAPTPPRYITCRKRRRKLRRRTSQLEPAVGSERGRRVGRVSTSTDRCAAANLRGSRVRERAAHATDGAGGPSAIKMGDNESRLSEPWFGESLLSWIETSRLRSSGFPAFGFGRYRPLPRFAIWQGNKYRCIDDGAASGTNGRGTSTAETIVCDRPDVPLRIGQRFHELGPPPGSPWVVVRMGGGADDAWAAYRRVVTADEEYTVVMVAVPPAEGSGSEWTVQLFRIPGHPFGLVSAVLNWNCIPEPIVAFARRALAVPVSRFYDDHCISEPEYAAFSSGLSAQASYFSLHELIRFHFDLGKHKPWSRCVVYCGVQTDWQDDVNSVVSIGVTRERRDKLRTRIAAILDANSLSPAEASSLRGKARWCVSPVFGRVGLAAVALLKQRQQSSSSELDDELRDALEFLGVVVDVLPQFVVRFRRGEPRPPVVVLTDASFETGHTWLGFLICCPIAGCVWAGEETPEWLLALLARHKRRESYIGQLETAIASGPYFTCPSMFRDRAVFHYVDNQGALYSLINGRSRDGDTNRLVFLTLLRAVQLRCDVWFDYVPSASNIADLPTRLDAAAFARLERIGTRVRPVRLPPEWCLECPNAQLAQLFDGEW